MKKLKLIGFKAHGANPICRDADYKLADSLGITYLDFNYVHLWEKLPDDSNYILDLGWMIDSLESAVIKFLKDNPQVVVRVVDGNLSDMKRCIVHVLYEINAGNLRNKVISPYNQNFGMSNLKVTVIPYHYDESDERKFTYFEHRIPKIVLTGNVCEKLKATYPLRYKLWKLSKKRPDLIDFIQHPGYSKDQKWSDNPIGSEYIDLLSKYQFMAITSSDLNYNLLKNVECAEAGCIPIGELNVALGLYNETSPFSSSLYDSITDYRNKSVGRLLQSYSSVNDLALENSLESVIKELSNDVSIAESYRDYMKYHYSKSSTLKKLNSVFL